jgi:hypothetical protein
MSNNGRSHVVGKGILPELYCPAWNNGRPCHARLTNTIYFALKVSNNGHISITCPLCGQMFDVYPEVEAKPIVVSAEFIKKELAV